MLYIHIPYCHHKCTYCGFYSVAGRNDMESYVEAVCKELGMRSCGEHLKTVYFGGGTPSLLPLPLIRRIVGTIRDCFDVSKLEEVTIEANPENLTPEYLAELYDLHFFNRISIGVQSFHDKELHTLNRVHNVHQAIAAVVNTERAGFNNVSIDLIMGLPGQTADSWKKNLDTVGELLKLNCVRHLSCYELTVESGSILERQLRMGRVELSSDEVLVAQYQILLDWCMENGFVQYEVSNFCIPGWHSRHNSRYWNRTPYLGVGAAAHSFDGTMRRWNIADTKRYISGVMSGSIPCEKEMLTDDDAYNEYVMTSLRTVTGIEKAMVAEKYRNYLSQKIYPFVNNGFVTETQTHYRPTAEGLIRADGIAASLFYSKG